MFDLNPIDVLNQRELKFLPVHFSKIKISDSDVFDNKMTNWIRSKLKGRFCIVRIPDISEDGKLRSSNFVAFEDQKELTYFVLACPYLRRTK